MNRKLKNLVLIDYVKSYEDRHKSHKLTVEYNNLLKDYGGILRSNQ